MRIDNLSGLQNDNIIRIEYCPLNQITDGDIQLLLDYLIILDEIINKRDVEISDLTDEKVSLQDEVSDLRGEIKYLEQEIDKLENKLRELE